MKLEELEDYLANVNEMFDHVRLVDYANQSEISIDEDGLHVSKYHCYSYWLNQKRCTNCISARAYETHEKVTKFEFIGDKVYMIVARYIEVDGKGCVVECITQIDDVNLLDGNEEALRVKMREFHDHVYIDPVTGLYNRKFYEDQVMNIEYQGVILITMDTHKEEVIDLINDRIRKNDIFIRVSENEYIVGFIEIPEERFNNLTSEINEILMENHVDCKLKYSYGTKKAEAMLETLREDS